MDFSRQRGVRFNPDLCRVFLILVCMAAGCRHEAPPQVVLTPVEVDAAQPVRGDSVSPIRFTGSVRAATQVDLAFKNGGYVARIMNVRDRNGQLRLVQEGDTVRAGELLAELRQGDYMARVAQAQAQRAQAAAGVAQAQGGQEQARATQGQATSGLAEAEAARLAARSQVEEAQAGQREAQQQVEAARIAGVQAERQVEEAQAGVGQAQAGADEAEAGLTKARQDFQRADTLYKEESLTKTDYDAAAANYAAAQAKRRQAQKQVEAAQAKEAQARAQVQSAQNRIAQAQEQVTAAATRVAQARAQVGVREAQAAQARARIAAAAAAVKTARAQVQGAQAVTQGANAQLTAAQIPLGESALRAPIDGVLLNRRIEVGTLVGQGTPAFSIADVSQMKLDCGVPDTQVLTLKPGQAVKVYVEALNQEPYTGRITAIAAAADPRTRVFNVEVTVPNPRRRLRVGMIATLTLADAGATPRGALVPLAALIRPDTHPAGYAIVVVSKEGDRAVAHLHDVQMGAVYGNRIAVYGVDPGAQVVTTGASLVHEGEAVNIIGASASQGASHGAHE